MQKKSQKRVDYWFASDTNWPYDCAEKRVDYWLALYENSKCRNALRKIDMILEVMK